MILSLYKYALYTSTAVLIVTYELIELTESSFNFKDQFIVIVFVPVWPAFAYTVHTHTPPLSTRHCDFVEETGDWNIL